VKTSILLTLMTVGLLVLSSSAQSLDFEGMWYGTINPPGAQFDVAVNLRRTSDGWTGTLLLENGNSIPVKDVITAGTSISFSLEAGPSKVTFAGVLEKDANEISGEFIQEGSRFPFKLNRTPTPALQGAAVGIDPSELIAMITSFSGSLSERPFVPPLTHPAIEYGVRPARDPIAKLTADVQAGKAQLKFQGEQGYLKSLLELLQIPIESQIAVFSKTSVQSNNIGPSNPRVLYFNDSVAVGSVRGGFIEIASQDPEQGIIFYMLPQQPEAKPFFIKREECLSCHLSRNSLDVPGMLVRSVYTAPSGTPINPLGSYLVDHRTNLEQRWGGWYVTGNSGSMRHLGNVFVSNPDRPDAMISDETLNLKTLKDKFDTDAYLSPYSDAIAMLVFNHQMHMMNLITRLGWEFRIAASLENATHKKNDEIDRQLRDATAEFVDYLLFIDEAPIRNKIGGTSGFAEKFAVLGPVDTSGRSLRQFDLEHRLMRYPCSYMIYSPAFDALPSDAKQAIYTRIRKILGGEEKDPRYAQLTSADRRAITEILQDTKSDF
jgi:hypothetical protein